MATATFKLFGKTVPEIVEKVRDIIAKVIANVAVYATPNPPAATLTTQVNALEQSYMAAINGGKDKKALMRLDKQKLLQSMSILQAYVQTTSGGNESKILLVADVKKTPSPAGILSPPVNVRTFFGYVNGQVRLLYGGVSGRIFYRVQVNPTPGNDAGWTDFTYTTKVRVLITGLVSGTEYAIRIATASAEGIGSWSDPVIQKAL